jgi:hypothetical protein
MDERLLDCPDSRILAATLEATPVEIPRAGLTVNKRNKHITGSIVRNSSTIHN